ncbi:Tyrosine recombinase XerC [Cupriavidus yeoncheonensis]|uniref:Tyrosine recombinase XerC n=1 Tax=Cupriavidus yeoncheonensis TaxID=1462994 RepID=A0A916N173_9BURK|nr:site-specific integrase [Cupriavidus yeoncheonensis]CAG2126523.1 Tyrosine recombinase XerC [Cupriavidus yeoncheonensis]
MAKTRTYIDRDFCRSLKATGVEQNYADSKLRGFAVRVSAEGTISFIQHYLKPGKTVKGKQQQGKLTVGHFPAIEAEAARVKALDDLKEAITKRDPVTVQQEKQAKRDAEALATSTRTIGWFIDKHFETWECAHAKTGKDRVQTLRASFKPYLDMPLVEFNVGHAEDWITTMHSVVVRHGKRKGLIGLANGTINRNLGILSCMFTLAWKKKFIAVHPLYRAGLHKPEPLRKRVLTLEEVQRLFDALYRAEEAARAKRDRGNARNLARGYPLLPDLRLVPYTSPMIPMVIWARETGERQQEMRLTKWSAVFLEAPRPFVIVEAETCKTEKERIVYLSAEAIHVLTLWRTQSTGEYVFPNRAGTGPIGTIRKAWKTILADAGVADFDWRDFRHDFASQMVMRGVPLKAVGDLLGHEDPKMTQRYATFAPDHLADTVARLDAGRTVSERTRLPLPLDLLGHEEPKVTQRYATFAPDHLADTLERLDAGRAVSERTRRSLPPQ